MQKGLRRPLNVMIKTLKVFCKCKKMVNRQSKAYIWIILSISVIQGGLPALLLVLLQKIINFIQLHNKQALIMVLVYVSISLLQIILGNLYEYYIIRFNYKFGKYVDEQILEKALQLNLSDYENPKIYDVINRAQVQRGENLLNYLNSFFSILKDIIAACSTILILINYEWWIVIVILIIPIIQYFYSIKIANIQYQIMMSRTFQERKVWYINFLMVLGSAFKEIKLYGLKDYFIKIYDKLRCDIINQDLKVHKKSLLVTVVLEIVDHLISGVLFLLFVFQGLKGGILLGDVTAYIECINKVKDSSTAIFSGLSNVFRNSLDIELLFTFLEMETENKQKKEKKQIQEINTIELQHIFYKYAGSDTYSLTDVSCILKTGDILGIVGENGSGKSTLLKIILGFYENYEGKILINGIELREIDKESYFKKIGCLFQDYIKYETSIRENIAYGRLKDIENDQKIERMLKEVGFTKILNKKQGIDTIVGNWFGGYQPSSGEWQRIAIARAIIKDADLFVLDEPDSSLDVNAEVDLLKIYDKYFKGKIGIIVTHKIPHIHFLAKKIIVMKNGKIVESGTHKELLRKNGEYYYLYNIYEQIK